MPEQRRHIRPELPGGFLGLILLVLPSASEAWRAYNRHEVFEIEPGIYEVVSQPGSGAADFWCGIGDFTRVVLGVGPTQRIYIWRAIGPSVTRPGRKAVHFAFQPPESGTFDPGYSLSVKKAGDSLNASFARQYCFGSKFTEPFERWLFD